MWAITPAGVGKPVAARRVLAGWQLVNAESFTVPDSGFSTDMVLDADGVSLRAATPAELDRPPQQITPLQMRRALRVQGYAAVKTALSSASVDLQDQWEAMQIVHRNGPFIAFLKATLSKTDQQIDDFFRLAATL